MGEISQTWPGWALAGDLADFGHDEMPKGRWAFLWSQGHIRCGHLKLTADSGQSQQLQLQCGQISRSCA